jgi:hypothetical protein
MLYSFILFLTVWLQDNRIQTGIKKAVKIIINKAIPSTPKTILEFAKTSQSTVENN